MQTKNIFFFLIILILSSSFVQADTSAPSPSEKLKGRAKVEGLEDTHSPISYKKITLNAEMLSREIAQTTGLALNPILCMSVLGGYYYFTTPEEHLSALPWHLSPQFWGPLTLLLGLIFLKDTFGVAFPKLLKSPLDAAEILFEKNTSALIALPVLINSVQQGEMQQMQQLAQQVYHLLSHAVFPVAVAATGATDAAGGALNSSTDLLLLTMTSITMSMIFIVVWVLSQAFNVLILLCPFSIGDALLAAAKNALVVLVLGLSGTYVGALLSLLVIAVAVYLFPKTLRLVVFGTVMSYDLVFYKLLRSKTDSLPADGIRCFSSCSLGQTPPLTYGKLTLQDGVIQFSYRSCLFLSKKTLYTGIKPLSCEVIRGILSPVIVVEHKKNEQIQIFRIRPKFYRDTEQIAERLKVRWNDDAVIIKRFSGAVKWFLALLQRSPKLDIPTRSS
ncbi:MAG: hypothetical protein D3911_13940 [Candidatus Electrothrix sp. AW3_4]|nr:hypothetical protein [Candidatus Electrothrix gigas]